MEGAGCGTCASRVDDVRCASRAIRGSDAAQNDGMAHESSATMWTIWWRLILM